MADRGGVVVVSDGVGAVGPSMGELHRPDRRVPAIAADEAVAAQVRLACSSCPPVVHAVQLGVLWP